MGIQPETQIQSAIRLAVSAQCPDVVLFRNQTGALRDPRTGRLITFGLAPGSPDLVGWRSVLVTPEMVGSRLAVFCGVEVKTPAGRVRPEQTHWLDRLGIAGGITGVVRSVESAIELLGSNME
jgi:hypothetical protein